MAIGREPALDRQGWDRQFHPRRAGLDKAKYAAADLRSLLAGEEISDNAGDGFGEAISMPTCSPVNDGR